MTPAEIAALRALADAATPEPWAERPDSGKVAKRNDWHTIIDERGVPVVQTGFVEIHPGDGEESYAEAGVKMRPEDRSFIAAARTAVPALLDEVERLRGALRGVLSAMPKQMATVADADRLRPHIDHARHVLGETGKDGG